MTSNWSRIVGLSKYVARSKAGVCCLIHKYCLMYAGVNSIFNNYYQCKNFLNFVVTEGCCDLLAMFLLKTYKWKYDTNYRGTVGLGLHKYQDSCLAVPCKDEQS